MKREDQFSINFSKVVSTLAKLHKLSEISREIFRCSKHFAEVQWPFLKYCSDGILCKLSKSSTIVSEFTIVCRSSTNYRVLKCVSRRFLECSRILSRDSVCFMGIRYFLKSITEIQTIFRNLRKPDEYREFLRTSNRREFVDYLSSLVLFSVIQKDSQLMKNIYKKWTMKQLRKHSMYQTWSVLSKHWINLVELSFEIHIFRQYSELLRFRCTAKTFSKLPKCAAHFQQRQ